MEIISDRDSGSNRKFPRLIDFFAPARMDSSHEVEKKQSHPLLASQSSRYYQKAEHLPSPSVELRLGLNPLKSPFPPLTPPPSTEVSTHKPPLHLCSQPLKSNPLGNQETLTSRTQIESESKDTTEDKQKHCNCKYSRCLKMYCECFESGSYCSGCNCLNCHNNPENEALRKEAVSNIFWRNKKALKPKISATPLAIEDIQENHRGCQCKKGCLKKHCECFSKNVLCSEKCGCQQCKNFEGSEERRALLHKPQASETYIHQTTNAAFNNAINLSGYMNLPESRKRKTEEASLAVPRIVQTQAVNHVIKNGDTSVISIPSSKAISESTKCSYRSSLSNTIELDHIKELCSLMVTKTLSGKKQEQDKRISNAIHDSPDCVLDGNRMDETPLSPATRSLMCDDEHMIISEEEASTPVRTGGEKKEDKDTVSEIYLEQESQILSCFKGYLIHLSKCGNSNGANIKTNTRKETEDEEQRHI